MKTWIGAAAVMAVTLAAGGAQAAKMLSPVSVVVNSGGSAGPLWAVRHIINQSGLDKKYTPGVTEFEDFIASGPRHGDSSNTQWLSSPNTTAASITFDFGTEVTLASVAWWDAFTTSNSLIRMSTPTLGNFKSFSPIEGTATGPRVQAFDFRPVTTRFLTFEFEGCNNASPYTGCGVQEVAFAAGVAGGAVPEPATWAMMILGFGAAGSVLRRRLVIA